MATAEPTLVSDLPYYAAATQHQALLVTNDRLLKAQLDEDGYKPGCLARPQLEQALARR